MGCPESLRMCCRGAFWATPAPGIDDDDHSADLLLITFPRKPDGRREGQLDQFESRRFVGFTRGASDRTPVRHTSPLRLATLQACCVR